MIYAFGECELDSDLHELRVAKAVRAIEPQAFDLLLHLIKNSDRMVSKDELFEAIWEGRIVSEASLSNRINVARQAIVDSGKKQKLIRTFPRRGFRFVGDVEIRGAAGVAGADGQLEAAGAKPDAGDPKRPEKPSIAVLPFENLSADPEQEYFSDGITEDIIAGLSRIRQFLVIARHSTNTYKGQAVDVRTVAKDLGVRYVLDGSVRKSGERVRISAQLIDGETGNQLWTDRFDRDLEDIFAVQDEITQTVVGALQPELSRSEIERARRKPPESLDAWELYQRGVGLEFHFNKTDNAAAIELFSKAIELDPELAYPYAGLDECLIWDEFNGYAERGLEDAFTLARKAVQIDPQDASAHKALGVVHFMNRDAPSAIAEVKIAIQLDPSAARTYAFLGYAQSHSGSAEDALESFRAALKLSPRDPALGWFYNGMALAFLFLQRHEESVEWARKALQHPPIQTLMRAHFVSALGHLDREEETGKALADLQEFHPGCTISIVLKQLSSVVSENAFLDHHAEGLRKAGLPE